MQSGYVLKLDGRGLVRADNFAALWKEVVSLCGHMTVSAFTDRGYKIERENAEKVS